MTSVPFANIPPDLALPGWFFEIGASGGEPGAQIHPSLMIAPKLSAGTAVVDTPYLVFSASQIAELGGIGSVGHHMGEAFFANHPFGKLWVMFHTDASGSAAQRVVTFTASSAKAGTVYCRINGRKLNFNVAADDNATAVGAAFHAAIAADATLGVTSTDNADGTVDVDLDHDGVFGQLDVRFNYAGQAGGESFPSGVGASQGAMSAGVGAIPSLANIVAAMGDTGYDDIIVPSDDYLLETNLAAEIAARWGWDRQVHGHVHAASWEAAFTTTGPFASLNDENMTNWELVDVPTPPWVWAAACGGIAAKGLAVAPHRALTGREIKAVLPPPPGSAGIFTKSQRDSLIKAGGATFRVAGGKAVIEFVATTNTTDSFGNPTSKWRPIQRRRVLARMNRERQTEFSSKYADFNIVDDDTLTSDRKTLSPKDIKGILVAKMIEFAERGWAEKIDDYVENVRVERDKDNPDRINVYDPPNLANQLRIGAFLVDPQV